MCLYIAFAHLTIEGVSINVIVFLGRTDRIWWQRWLSGLQARNAKLVRLELAIDARAVLLAIEDGDIGERKLGPTAFAIAIITIAVIFTLFATTDVANVLGAALAFRFVARTFAFAVATEAGAIVGTHLAIGHVITGAVGVLAIAGRFGETIIQIGRSTARSFRLELTGIGATCAAERLERVRIRWIRGNAHGLLGKFAIRQATRRFRVVAFFGRLHDIISTFIATSWIGL